MADLRITELDFDQIKQNFINYLQSQDTFKDYNFSGSALNVLLDVLAYNTHYNAILAHLQTNEMFIDTALKRSSIVSIAKTLGYTPRSVVSARAHIGATFTSTDAGPITIPKYTKFTAKVNDTTYTFLTANSATASKSGSTFAFPNIELFEGSFITQSNVVTTDTVSGPFTIKNNNIDLSTLNVQVQNSISDLGTTPFARTTTVINITDTSNVYWVEEGQDGYYRLIFGDGIIGSVLSAGNIVNISYVASKGANANGAQSFSCSSTFTTDNAPVITTLVSASSGGANRETADSIRFNAPKINATRNRVVTAEDYKAIIMANFDKAQSVEVWGGENNVPPIYGKVFISIDPKVGYTITSEEKEALLTDIIRPRSVMSLTHEFVDPIYLNVGLNVAVTYDQTRTLLTATQLQSLVNAQITKYFTDELSTLGKQFYFSQLENRIQNTDGSILGTLIDMRLQRRISPFFNIIENLNIYFTTPIEPNSFRSSNFKTMVNGLNYNSVYVRDLPNDTPPSRTGTGTLQLINGADGRILDANYGTIAYGESGMFTLTRLYVTELLGGDTVLRFNAMPQDLGKNLTPKIVRSTATSTSAVYPYPSQNIIITLDDSATNSTTNTQVGLAITVNTVAN